MGVHSPMRRRTTNNVRAIVPTRAMGEIPRRANKVIERDTGNSAREPSKHAPAKPGALKCEPLKARLCWMRCAHERWATEGGWPSPTSSEVDPFSGLRLGAGCTLGRPEVLPDEVSLPFAKRPSDVDRALALDEPTTSATAYFGGIGQQHVHMVRHHMDLLHPALLCSVSIPDTWLGLRRTLWRLTEGFRPWKVPEMSNSGCLCDRAGGLPLTLH
jgi:hypothetical protein